jgi:hypothetical protein
MAQIYGINAVGEALKARRVSRLVHERGAGARVDALGVHAGDEAGDEPPGAAATHVHAGPGSNHADHESSHHSHRSPNPPSQVTACGCTNESEELGHVVSRPEINSCSPTGSPCRASHCS